MTYTTEEQLIHTINKLNDLETFVRKEIQEIRRVIQGVPGLNSVRKQNRAAITELEKRVNALEEHGEAQG